MLFGGLRPIPYRLVLDGLTVAGLAYGTMSPVSTPAHPAVLATCSLLTILTAGWTRRWTLTLPMVPFLLLQTLRYFVDGSFAMWAVGSLSIALVLLSMLLSVLFPAVEIPPVEGPYHVGTVNLLLPNKTGGSCLSVRVLYPTLERPSTLPYLTPTIAVEFCRQTMRFGAPPPLKKWGWMLHTWRLARIRAKRNASLLPGDTPLPVVVFSHGLGGTAELYSYQTMALAAHGHVVVSVTHSDGSAPVVDTGNDVQLFDFEVAKLWQAGKNVEYVKARRSRTNQRVQELFAVIEGFLKLNKEQTALHGRGVSFQGRLSTDKVTLMGHSFGGATVLTAAARQPTLVRSVIAHEPAVDWMPDDARRSLFPDNLLRDRPHKFTGGTGGYEDDGSMSDESIHDKLDILVLYSSEWHELEWGASHIMEDLHATGRLGRKGGVSEFKVIHGATHSEFSDTCLLTPVWLGRVTGVTGRGNPVETAHAIKSITQSFLNKVHVKSS